MNKEKFKQSISNEHTLLNFNVERIKRKFNEYIAEINEAIGSDSNDFFISCDICNDNYEISFGCAEHKPLVLVRLSLITDKSNVVKFRYILQNESFAKYENCDTLDEIIKNLDTALYNEYMIKVIVAMVYLRKQKHEML